MPRIIASFCLALAITTAPANAQIFWQTPDLAGAPIFAPEAGFGLPLPGATAAETKAALTWSLRSGLNVAALQCGFEPTLRTLENYNALLTNHREELASAFTILSSYFKRTNKTIKAGQGALDTYGGRIYSSFSAVRGQFTFCTAASKVSTSALFAPRGQLITVAQERLRELYNGVNSKAGEQMFRPTWTQIRRPALANMDAKCWKKNAYFASCGYSPFF